MWPGWQLLQAPAGLHRCPLLEARETAHTALGAHAVCSFQLANAITHRMDRSPKNSKATERARSYFPRHVAHVCLAREEAWCGGVRRARARRARRCPHRCRNSRVDRGMMRAHSARRVLGTRGVAGGGVALTSKCAENDPHQYSGSASEAHQARTVDARLVSAARACACGARAVLPADWRARGVRGAGASRGRIGVASARARRAVPRARGAANQRRARARAGGASPRHPAAAPGARCGAGVQCARRAHSGRGRAAARRAMRTRNARNYSPQRAQRKRILNAVCGASRTTQARSGHHASHPALPAPARRRTPP